MNAPSSLRSRFPALAAIDEQFRAEQTAQAFRTAFPPREISTAEHAANVQAELVTEGRVHRNTRTQRHE
jgi:hypothetical protein